jgi:hypothetical protein
VSRLVEQEGRAGNCKANHAAYVRQTVPLAPSRQRKTGKYQGILRAKGTTP